MSSSGSCPSEINLSEAALTPPSHFRKAVGEPLLALHLSSQEPLYHDPFLQIIITFS